MRTSRWTIVVASLLALPTVASAQVYYPPAPIGAVPPHVYIQQRIRWHVRRHIAPQVMILPQAPPVYIAPMYPSPPPPPVYMAPPPPQIYIVPQRPIYVQPQPIYAPPPPCCAAPAVAAMAVVQQAPLPQFASRFGLGVTGEGLASIEGDSNQGWGIMGQIRYRAARHLGIEIMGGYERSHNDAGFVRRDVPITGGLLIHILGPEYMLSPYFVAAGGVNFADLRLLDAPTMKIDDARTQLVGQLGGGLELRLGQHFALNADARFERHWSLEGPTDAVKNTNSINGKPVRPIHDESRVRIGVGATVYF